MGRWGGPAAQRRVGGPGCARAGGVEAAVVVYLRALLGISGDLIFLTVFAALMMGAATMLFRRTL